MTPSPDQALLEEIKAVEKHLRELRKKRNRRARARRQQADLSDFETAPRGTVDELERLRKERDTLAAHVERLSEADLMDDVREGDYTPDSFTNQPMRAILAEAPATSLASRDLLKQAEVLEEAGRYIRCEEDAALLRINAQELRRQADMMA